MTDASPRKLPAVEEALRVPIAAWLAPAAGCECQLLAMTFAARADAGRTVKPKAAEQ